MDHDRSEPANEYVYKTLRNRIMAGEMAPGDTLTLRGIGQEFHASMTPAREAVRRLVAEGALSFTSTGRIVVPILSNERIEELAAIRALLEPELAARALPRAHFALIDRLDTINHTIAQIIAKGDAVGYVRTNMEFHRTLYLRAQSPAMLALIETVWLQAGPTMRSLYRQLPSKRAAEKHQTILQTLRAGDEPGLRLAIRSDVTSGLRMLLA